MKWPKEWIEMLVSRLQLWGQTAELQQSIDCGRIEHRFDSEKILDSLHEIGALKDPPKPREWWFCTQHCCSQIGGDKVPFCDVHVREFHRKGWKCKWIKVREVPR